MAVIMQGIGCTGQIDGSVFSAQDPSRKARQVAHKQPQSYRLKKKGQSMNSKSGHNLAKKKTIQLTHLNQNSRVRI